MDKTYKIPSKTIEDRISSLSAITVSVLLYISGYAVKLSVLFNDLLNEIIPHEYLRMIASGSTGIALAMGLLIVSVNEKHKIVSCIIGISDFMALLLIFKIFKADSIEQYSKCFFISGFMAFVGFHLIQTFVRKYQESKSFRDREQLADRLKQELNGLKQKVSNTSAEQNKLKQDVSKMEQKKSEMERKIKETTCSKCGRYFNTKNALNAHKCKPEDIEAFKAKSN
ncbi:PspA/IM30 family protein [Aquimarina spongiae]|nr:hypothetical protein [Aquimarina spongiae]